MVLLLSLLVVVFPSILWILVVRWWDRHEPEPRRLIAHLFLWGVIGGFIATGAEKLFEIVAVTSDILPPFDALSLNTGALALAALAGGIACFHETMKFCLTRALTARESAFTEVVDGIVYAATLGFGTALVANLVALLKLSLDPAGVPDVAFLHFLSQSVFTSLLYGVSAGYMGFALGTVVLRRKLTRHGKFTVLVGGLAVAITLHATFRFLSFLSEPRLAGLLATIAAVHLFSHFALRVSARPRRQTSDVPLP